MFDAAAADRVVQFFELFLRHSTGEWAGQAFTLQPWQAKILRTAFGWKRRCDGLRRYRTVYLRIPRKNGKSTLAAGVALYTLFADHEPRAEIYGAANDKEQASIVFREASRMVRASPELLDMCQVFGRSIVVPETLASYQALSSETGNKDGLNIHALVLDELHEFNDRALWDKLTTAMGARRQPLTLICTTAGVGRHTLYAETDEHARRVARGEVEDESFLPVLFGAEQDDDWHDPRVWARANPNLGVSVKLSYLEEQHRKAVLMPAYENTFKRYHLNLDTEQIDRWIAVDAWDKCVGGEVEAAALAGRECWIGLDLSKRTDITAMVAVFREPSDRYRCLCRFFVPAAGVAERARRDKVPYDRWIGDGLITATEGNVIDYSFIRAELERWARVYQVQEVAYDPYGATQLALQLQDDGLTCVEFRQGTRSMSEPSKLLEDLVLSRRFAHGGNPVLRWMLQNVAIETDGGDNIKPSKRKSTGRIDGIVALVMALGRASVRADSASVYESRGIIEL